jgi:hypothetical protein
MKISRGVLSISAALILAMGSCSKDDKECDSCKAQDQKIEMCDNGNGTYTLSAGGQSETVTEAELSGMTPKEFINVICTLANTTTL